jgi:hypothetical protein
MRTATNESRNSTPKRLRIDPNATMPKSSPTAMPNDDATTSTKALTPTATAVAQIEQYTASLFPQMQPILLKLAKPHLQLLLQRQKKEELLNNITTAITIAEDDTNTNPPKWPKSANLKFKLSVPKELLTNPEFVALDAATKAYVETVRLHLTKQIHSATQIEIKSLTQSINASLAKALFHITVAVLKSSDDAPADDPKLVANSHTIVNSILDNAADDILQFSYCMVLP